MDNIRRRIPFRFAETSAGEPENDQVLDEQEQEEIIQKLRSDNLATNQQYLLVLRVILALSFLVQFKFLFSSSKDSPILVLFPTTIREPHPPVPLPTFSTLFSIVLHLNLALLAHPNELKPRLQLAGVDLRPLPYQLCYTLAAITPTLCVFLGRSWQTTTWWCLTSAMVFITQTIVTSIDEGNENISQLETMKYMAPGA